MEYLVQTTHPGFIHLDGDTASGRTYIQEIIHLRDGSSHLNYAIYHDRYQRTGDGWKFTERAYQVRYLDTTPLTGSAPKAADGTAPQTWPRALPPEEDEHGLDAAVDVFFLGQA